MLFDSFNDNILAGKLFRWVKDSLKAEIKFISVSHWHKDHSGGLDTLHKLGVESYSYYMTKEFMSAVGQQLQNIHLLIQLQLILKETKILLAFCGAGHTMDNSVGWINDEKILFRVV